MNSTHYQIVEGTVQGRDAERSRNVLRLKQIYMKVGKKEEGGLKSR